MLKQEACMVGNGPLRRSSGKRCGTLNRERGGGAVTACHVGTWDDGDGAQMVFIYMMMRASLCVTPCAFGVYPFLVSSLIIKPNFILV